MTLSHRHAEPSIWCAQRIPDHPAEHDHLIRRIEEKPAIVLRNSTRIVTLEGGGHLERVRWRNEWTGSVETHHIGHVFAMSGAVPSTE